MTTRSKWLIAGGAVAVLGLLLASWAAANQVERRFGPGPGWALEHLDERVADLNLTEAQKTEYEALKNALKAKMSMGLSKRREVMAGLKQELAKDKPDLEVMFGLIKSGMGELSTGLGQTLDRLAGFYAVLNPDQQKQVMDRFKDRMDCWEKFGPRHGPWRHGPWHDPDSSPQG